MQKKFWVKCLWYNIFMYIISFVISLICSIGFLFGAFLYYKYDKRFIEKGICIPAVITNIENRRQSGGRGFKVYVKVAYEIDGTKYENEMGTYFIGMKKGKTIPIKYMPDNPQEINYAKHKYLTSWIALFCGLAALTAAAASLYFLITT